MEQLDLSEFDVLGIMTLQDVVGFRKFCHASLKALAGRSGQ